VTTKARTPKAAKPAKRPPAKKAGRAATPPSAAPTVPEVVPLSALDLTVAKAVRAGTDGEAVERYRLRYAAGEAMPPLECTGTRGRPDTPVWVGDGGHRALALTEAGKSSAECVVHWCDTPAEAEAKAWEIAYAGNTAHGLPRSSADLRAAIRSALLREPPATSDRALADKLHCHRVPIVKVRVQMTEAGELTGKASAEGRYKESEYQQWVTGKGERPKAKATAAEPTTPPAARPPQPEPAADTDWRERPLSAAGLDTDLATRLGGEMGVGTLGDLADALDGDESAAKLLDLFGEVVCERLAGVIDGSRPAAPDDAPAWSAPAGTPTADPTPPAPAVVRDEKGRPVPAALVPAFDARSHFRSLSQRVGGFLKEVEALAAAPGGGAIQLNPVRADAKSFTSGVAGAMPYVVCPECGGAGVQAGRVRACPQCVAGPGEKAGRGWVCRLRFDQFDPALKRKADGPWDDAPVEGQP
jgi:hypothetical protein